jgi:glycosyltransferase involved in cell wall biosynthesis
MIVSDLICLVPVRNGERFLPQFFESLRPVCNQVIALDDGSTDRTGELLRAEPIVRLILENPRRQSYAGWDDAANRARLLAACAERRPKWILWLDSDETLPADDSARLVKFLAEDADPSAAYGFEILRMIGDAKHYDKGRLWVYRLHGYRPDYVLPTETLHFEPVPVQIPRSSWKRTRMRILHFAGLSDELRRQRYRKYGEADPERRWQESYESLLDEPGHVWSLKPLPPGIPLIID